MGYAYIYIRHQNLAVTRPGCEALAPAIVIPITDSSTLAPSGAKTGPTDGSTVVLRNGREVKVLAGIFANWPQVPKGHLAMAMEQGYVKVFEVKGADPARELTADEVLVYVAPVAP